MQIRFDTRNKKPKLYHLAVIAVLTIAALLPLFRSSGSGQLKWTGLILSAFFILTVILLADAFRKQLE